jgi:hypothetical protein
VANDNKKIGFILGSAALVAGALILMGKKQETTGIGSLVGKVTNQNTGQPIADVLVSLGGYYASTDQNGDYYLAAIPAGIHSLTFVKSGYQTVQRVSIEIVIGENRLDITMIPISQAEASLSGTVTDLNGYPVAGADIWLVGYGYDATNDLGQFSITSTDPIYPGNYVLSVSKSGYITNQQSITLVEGENDVNVYLTPGTSPTLANILGTVRDSDGNPLSGVDVFIYPWIDPQSNYTVTGSAGTYSYDDIEPGTYELTFEKSGYQAIMVTVSPAAGDNIKDVILLPISTDAVSIDVFKIKINPSTETINLEFTLTNHTSETLRDISNYSFNTSINLRLYNYPVPGEPGEYFTGKSFTNNTGDLPPGTSIKTFTLPRHEYVGNIGWFEHDGISEGIRGYAEVQFVYGNGAGDGSVIILTEYQPFAGIYSAVWQNWPIDIPVQPAYWSEPPFSTTSYLVFPPSWWPTSDNGTWVLVTYPYWSEWISDEYLWLLPGEVAAYLAANSGWRLAP